MVGSEFLKKKIEIFRDANIKCGRLSLLHCFFFNGNVINNGGSFTLQIARFSIFAG
jgi:hypothetical protein